MYKHRQIQIQWDIESKYQEDNSIDTSKNRLSTKYDRNIFSIIEDKQEKCNKVENEYIDDDETEVKNFLKF